MIDDKNFPVEGKIFALDSLQRTLAMLADVEHHLGNEKTALLLREAATNLHDAAEIFRNGIAAERGDNVVSLAEHRKK